MSKFLEKENFVKDSTPYDLLPFRFARIEGEILLTNLVGEFIWTDETTLEDLVKYKVDKQSEIYVDLRSKQFVSDEQSQVNSKLLGIKYKTRQKRISEFTSLHMFVLSLRCEHSCPYCQVSRQSDDKLTFDMSLETASKAIDFALSSPSKNLKFEFQGGEPLLNFETLKFIVLEAKKRNQGKNLSFVIATNLALLNDEILDFCKIHRIDISTSLDGPEEIHNKNRPRPGRNSYELTIAGIKRAREKLGFPHVNALMTTTAASLERPQES